MKTNNGMEAQLIELTRQVALHNSRAQPDNEVYGICCIFGYGANLYPQNMYEPKKVNYMDANQPR